MTDLPPAPTRKAALDRLRAFTPLMGEDYARRRNFDLGPEDRSNVSALSPHTRCRLVRESELAAAALKRHGLQDADKFIQEVCWRTYWKGWLERRPSVWRDYKAQVRGELSRLNHDEALRARYEAAVCGRTGLECFDAWARELIETGWLHNHARMWFASIWIFTLDLPWALGADFFLRHLMDGDAASNTLSWRWVAGRQTAGKTYQARADNIAKYTGGRFRPDPADLAAEAPPPTADPGHPDPEPAPEGEAFDPRGGPVAVLIHDEDLHPESWGLDGAEVTIVLALSGLDARSPLPAGERASDFTDGAIADGLKRAEAHFGVPAVRAASPGDAADQAREAGAARIAAMRPFTGPLADRLAAEPMALPAVWMCRDWDAAFFPHADKGFFKLKKAIPQVLGGLGLR